MRARDTDGMPLPFARLWSEISIFFMAGMETTAHTIAWALCVAPHRGSDVVRVGLSVDACLTET